MRLALSRPQNDRMILFYASLFHRLLRRRLSRAAHVSSSSTKVGRPVAYSVLGQNSTAIRGAYPFRLDRSVTLMHCIILTFSALFWRSNVASGEKP